MPNHLLNLQLTPQTNTKTVASMRKTNSVVTNIEVEDNDQCMVVYEDDSEVTLIEDEIRNLFQDTSPEGEKDDE